MRKQIAYKLKIREKEIIDNLLRFRYLDRPQIQIILNHKYREKVIRWLNNLTNKNYIFRIYSKEFAGKPSEYCLDKKCIAYLREKEVEERIIKRIYAEKTRSQTFRDRSIFIASIYLSLLALTKKSKATLNFYTQADLDRIEHLPGNLPHVYFSIKGLNKRTKRYFIEIFDPQPPRMWLRERLKEYIEYFESSEWQDSTETKFPEIILAAPDEIVEKYLRRQIRKQIEDKEISFYLSTRNEIRYQGLNSEVLHKVET